jgi:Icc-related predicted phosphoesterase
MKLLVFSDLHRSETGLDKIVEKIAEHNADLVVCCGDITTFGPRSFAEEVVGAIGQMTLAVPGNCDPPEIHDVFDEGKFRNIHGRSAEIAGLSFIGWGGSNPGINTPFENPEPTIKEGLDTAFSELESNTARPTILVSHCPPYGFQDTIPDGSSVGCTSVAEIVENHRPVLTLCGHIHEARGHYTDANRKLHIVNVGPSKDGYYAVIELCSPEDLLSDPISGIKIQLMD